MKLTRLITDTFMVRFSWSTWSSRFFWRGRGILKKILLETFYVQPLNDHRQVTKYGSVHQGWEEESECLNKSVCYTASKVALSNSLYVSAHQNPMIHAYGVSKVNFASREKFISIANGVCRQAFIFFATSYFSLTAEAAEKRAQKICPFTGPPSYVRGFFQIPCGWYFAYDLDELETKWRVCGQPIASASCLCLYIIELLCKRMFGDHSES